MAIVTIAGIFGYVSSFCGIPQEMAMAIGGISSNKYVLLFIVLVFLLIAGMVMESTVNTLLFTPIFLPIVAAAGVDPVHFGILMMTVVTMGCMTPPVAVSMFAVCSILECSTTDYIRECWPYLIATLITLLLLVLFPDISMVLPNLVYPS
jgi:TRAP-type C4-dicarboxylate transport system permease large subunit